MNMLPHRSFYNPVEFNGIKKLFGLIDFVIKDAFFALLGKNLWEVNYGGFAIIKSQAGLNRCRHARKEAVA